MAASGVTGPTGSSLRRRPLWPLSNSRLHVRRGRCLRGRRPRLPRKNRLSHVPRPRRPSRRRRLGLRRLPRQILPRHRPPSGTLSPSASPLHPSTLSLYRLVCRLHLPLRIRHRFEVIVSIRPLRRLILDRKNRFMVLE